MLRVALPSFRPEKSWALWLGPLLFMAILLFGNLDPQRPEATAMAAIVAWVATWWFTEVVDLAVTSLLPFVLMPVLGIADPASTASQYMDPIIFLFIGGFIMAFAMEQWQLHTRLALGILSRTGPSPARILAGIMVTAFLLSMWVSNTATTLLLIPAVLAVITHIRGEQDDTAIRPLAVALLLGLAYSATMGGMSTLVGTPPNMYFYSFYQRSFPGDASLNFASFFAEAFTVTVLMALTTYAILRRRYLGRQAIALPLDYFREAYRQLGPLNRDQWRVILVFGATVLAWFTRPDMALGDTLIRGWASRTGLGSAANDGMVVIVACILLFVLPARTRPRRLLEWKDVQRLPFGIVLLFGSGFALAMGFEASGLSDWVAHQLRGLLHIHPLLLLLSIGLVVTTISEFASNIACVQLVLPVLASLPEEDIALPMRGLLMATALFASMGFMMPVATAPNTIVFGSGQLRTADMVRSGLWVNLAGVLIISLFMYFRYRT